MKKILYFPSENENSNHTSVEALFNNYLKGFFQIQIIYKADSDKEISENKLGVKNRKLLFSHKSLMQDFDIFIVRNDYKVLEAAFNYRKKSGKSFKIGFQPTFLHSYRRVVQSLIEQKFMLRKYIEYLMSLKKEKLLLQNCDFLLPNSKMMNIVLNKFNKPYEFIHSCFDFTQEPKSIIKNDDEIIRFIYIGTIDKVREFDKILKAFDMLSSQNFSLDIYTKEYDFAKKEILKMQNNQNKITIHKPLKRQELYEKISSFDVGVSLIPVNDLYNVASPIKLSEYFACSLATLSTAIPEAVELYANKNCIFFTQFDEISIKESLEKIIKTDKKTLKIMGENGKKIAYEKRNYAKVAIKLKDFLMDLR